MGAPDPTRIKGHGAYNFLTSIDLFGPYGPSKLQSIESASPLPNCPNIR